MVKQYEKDGKPAEATEAVAEMMYKLAQTKFDTYSKLRFQGEGKALERSITKKLKAYAETDIAFQEIVATGAGEWGIASMITLGKVYEDLANAWRTAPVPDVLDSDQREMYTMRLEDTAYPQEEKAVNVYKLALDTSFRLTLYNENTAFATRQLGELRPNEYPPLKEALLQPNMTSKPKGREFSYENEMK